MGLLKKEETPTHKSVKCVEVSCLHYNPSQGVIATAYIPGVPWFAYFSAYSPTIGNLKYLPWKPLIKSTIQPTNPTTPTSAACTPNLGTPKPPMKFRRMLI